jgi:hypothetical protein
MCCVKPVVDTKRPSFDPVLDPKLVTKAVLFQVDYSEFVTALCLRGKRFDHLLQMARENAKCTVPCISCHRSRGFESGNPGACPQARRRAPTSNRRRFAAAAEGRTRYRTAVFHPPVANENDSQ